MTHVCTIDQKKFKSFALLITLQKYIVNSLVANFTHKKIAVNILIQE